MMWIPHGRGTALGRLAVVAGWLFAVTGPVSATYLDTYIALGDGVAFGAGNDLTPSYGDQGYVKPYADWLATQNGGVRPKVINLAIPGELSTSYLTGHAPDFVGRTPTVNLNYANASTSQQDMLRAAVATAQAQGRTVGEVTFAVGAKEFGFIGNDPHFASLPPRAQQILFNQTVDLLQRNYTTALTNLRAVLPNTNLVLLDYYNPYGLTGPNTITNQWGQQFATAFQNMVQTDAAKFNARAVDIYAPFVGHEADYTFIQSGVSRPTDLGYGVIAQQLILASESPEPATLTLLGIGALGLLGYGWRRKRT